MGSNADSGCLSDDTLALFLEGELAGAEHQAAEVHLASCNSCLEILAAAGAARPDGADGEPGVPSESSGRYQLGGVLGRGGMGVVFDGLDRDTGQRIAIKRIRSDIADAPEFIERFEREAEILRRLAHPNIVRLLALEVSGEQRQIVMEYVSGGSLRELLSRGRVPLQRTLELAVELSDALARAHHLNVIHRDLKPENILLAADGSPRLSDFGLARFAQGAFTQTGVVIGTIAYQCPEVLSGQPADARSDVWAFGVVLFELLSGRRLFEAAHPGALITAILQAPLPDLAGLCPDAPPRLLTLLQRMLERAPARRIASMRQIGAELEGIAGSNEPRARSAPGSCAPARTPLVGRVRELERLDRWLSDAAAGAGKVVLISGEAGSGKTALCAELLERVRHAQPSWRLATGQCVEHLERGEAYAPFLQVVGALLDSDTDGQIAAAMQLHAPAWCLQFPARFSSPDLLAHLHRITLGAPGERMLRELGDMLGALARCAPIVLRLEDFHWADPASVDLLAALARRAPELRLLLLVTLRPDVLERGGGAAWLHRDLIARELGEEIALAPLAAADVQAYLEREYQPNDFAPELSQFVLRKTEGLALFATRLVRYLAEQRVIVRTDAGFQLSVPAQQITVEVPESMRALIRSKLASLSEAEREALCCASVEGDEFTSAVLARLLNSDVLALEERLRTLCSVHRLVAPLGEELLPSGELTLRYRFAHVLYRDALYADLAPRRQRALHLSIAQALVEQHAGQAQDSAARIATHFERGGDPRSAIDHWLVAADNEVRAYAFRDAAATLGHALELAAALPALERPRRSVEIHRRRVWALFRLDLVGEAMDELERVRTLAQGLGERELECDTLNALSHLAIFTHRVGEMEQLATEARTLAESIGNEGMALVARAHLAGGRLWAEPGTEAALEPIVQRARALHYEPAITIALVLLGVVHYFRGKYELCLPELEECLLYPVDVRQPQFVITVIRTIGSAHAHLGRIDAARKSFAEALDLARRNAFATPQLHTENDLYWLRCELGSSPRAEVLHGESGVRPSLELPADADGPAARAIVGTLYPLLEAEVNVVLCTRRQQRRAPRAVAEAAFELAELWTTRWRWWHWAQRLRLSAYRAQRALGAGELDTAHDQARGALELATHYGSLKYQALLRRILAEVAVERGELDSAADELAFALGLLVEFPIPLIGWKLEASLGRVQQLRNQSDAARAAFERAASVLETIARQIGDPAERAHFLTASHQELEGGESRSSVASFNARP